MKVDAIFSVEALSLSAVVCSLVDHVSVVSRFRWSVGGLRFAARWWLGFPLGGKGDPVTNRSQSFPCSRMQHGAILDLLGWVDLSEKTN